MNHFGVGRGKVGWAHRIDVSLGVELQFLLVFLFTGDRLGPLVQHIAGEQIGLLDEVINRLIIPSLIVKTTIRLEAGNAHDVLP